MRANLLTARAFQRETLRARRSNLRVGIFTDGYPPVVNGVSTSVHTLVEQLEAAGHSVYVFAPRFPGYTERDPNVLRFPSFITPFDRRYPVPFPLSPELNATLSRLQLDVVHSQSPFLLGLVALQFSRHNRVPLVATNHTLYLQYTHYVPFVPKPVISAMARAAVGWYYRSCDGVIAPSRMAARQLQEMFNVRPVPIQVIPSGIALPRPVGEDEIRQTRVKLGLPSRTTPMLLYAGRIAREKNLEMLLDAFEQFVLPIIPETRLILAGSGPDADVIQDRIVASDVLSGRVVLTGFLPRPALDPIYAAADLFVFPSGSETQGMVVGEALASGTPAVVVNEGGAPETVTDGEDGLRVANNAAAFGQAIVTLLRDDARRRAMSDYGRAHADVRTPERMAEQVIDIYWNAIQSAERGGPRSLRTFRQGQMRELIFYGNEQARESFRNSDRRIREQVTSSLRKRGRKIRVLIAKGLRPKGRR